MGAAVDPALMEGCSRHCSQQIESRLRPPFCDYRDRVTSARIGRVKISAVQTFCALLAWFISRPCTVRCGNVGLISSRSSPGEHAQPLGHVPSRQTGIVKFRRSGALASRQQPESQG